VRHALRAVERVVYVLAIDALASHRRGGRGALESVARTGNVGGRAGRVVIALHGGGVTRTREVCGASLYVSGAVEDGVRVGPCVVAAKRADVGERIDGLQARRLLGNGGGFASQALLLLALLALLGRLSQHPRAFCTRLAAGAGGAAGGEDAGVVTDALVATLLRFESRSSRSFDVRLRNMCRRHGRDGRLLLLREGMAVVAVPPQEAETAPSTAVGVRRPGVTLLALAEGSVAALR